MIKQEDLVMFGIVAAAAATSVFLYAWAVNNFSDRVPALADSAEAAPRPRALIPPPRAAPRCAGTPGTPPGRARRRRQPPGPGRR